MPRSLGVVLPPDLPTEEFLSYVRKAEGLGFAELWVVEDCFLRGGIAQAATVLASTTRMHVGIGILPVASRNAVFTTLEVAELANLHPGRLTLGLGHGMPGWMRQVGASVASPLTLLEEQVHAIRRLLRGECLTLRGRYMQLEDVALDRAPQVVPDVLVGARGPGSMAVAGRSADGVVLAEPVTPEYLAAARQQAGGPDRHRIVAYNLASVDVDPVRARAAARVALTWLGEPDWAPQIRPLPFADDLAALRHRSGSRSEFARRLPNEWVDQLSVTGTAEAGSARIAALHNAGADTVVLIPVGADRLSALDALARLL